MPSFAQAMLDHADTCSVELQWHDWFREAQAVAHGYEEAPSGNKTGAFSLIKDQICANYFPETLAARLSRKKTAVV